VSRENFSCSNSLLRFYKQWSNSSLFAASSSALSIVFQLDDNYPGYKKKIPLVWPSTLCILIFLYFVSRCVRLSSRYSYFFGQIRSNHVNATELPSHFSADLSLSSSQTLSSSKCDARFIILKMSSNKWSVIIFNYSPSTQLNNSLNSCTWLRH